MVRTEEIHKLLLNEKLVGAQIVGMVLILITVTALSVFSKVQPEQATSKAPAE